MKFSILHLSDIHLKERENHVLEKLKKIYQAVRNNLLDIEQLFIVISGDIAFSGKEEEYIEGMVFIEDLKKDIIDYSSVKIDIIMIPGNHDLDFSKQTKSREVLIDNVKNRKDSIIDKSVVSLLCGPQENCSIFIKNYETRESLVYEDPLFKTYKFVINGNVIVFNCLNTSWISELNETEGSLFYPIDSYKSVIEKNKGDFVITTLHHPYNWFDNENNRNLKGFLEKESDIILTGHEHVSTISKRVNYEIENTTEYIEGGILQGSNKEHSEFHLIFFDIVDKKYRFIRYGWEVDIYKEVFASDWLHYNRIRSQERIAHHINSNFKNYLDDPGIVLTHPRKANIVLDDIYIYPDADIVKPNENGSKFTKVSIPLNLKEIEHIGEVNKYIIIGEEKSGKTAFCKTVYKHFLSMNYVPILLKGQVINRASYEEFSKLLNQTYVDQYSEESLEHFKQLDNGKKVIIIDDIDKTKLNNRFQRELIKYISKHYKNIILTGNEFYKLFDILHDDQDEKDIITDFQRYEIREFGHLLRSELIHNWYTIGVTEQISENEFLSKVDSASDFMNTILGKNFVPSYPFFLLIILQTIESGTKHNAIESSYGYYYDYMITEALMKANLKHKEMDAFRNYISELSYHFFENGIYDISFGDLEKFHKYYNDKYDLHTEFSHMVKKLIESSLLREASNAIYFSHRYVYYFFVAKYISARITNDNIKEKVVTMCSNLHFEEYSNIIMFLTHMSKDPFVINEIIDQAKKIFAEFEPTRLENDIQELNRLILEIPKAVLKNVEVIRHREERLKALDEIERSSEETASDIDIEGETEDEEIDIVILKLNSAFKTLEIIGQILKNYYGSIEKEQKISLLEEAYFIGLRSLSSFLTTIENHKDAIVLDIKKIIEEKKLDKDDKKEKEAKDFLFNLCCMVSYQFIKKVSSSIGSESLAKNYNRVIERQESVAINLIDISIKLDHLTGIPFTEIRSLKNKITENMLALQVLRGMVINHLYMFNIEFKDKDKICNLLDISIEKQRSRDLLSARHKKILRTKKK